MTLNVVTENSTVAQSNRSVPVTVVLSATSEASVVTAISVWMSVYIRSFIHRSVFVDSNAVGEGEVEPYDSTSYSLSYT